MGKVEKGSRTFRTINLAFFAAGFVTFVTLYDVQPLLPVFSKEYGVPAALASLPLSLSTAALAATMLVAGTFSECFGRKPVMVASLFITSILALITPLTQSFPTLLGVRLIQGAVLAGLPAVAMAYLSEEVAPSSLAAAMGLYIGGNAVGGMTGRIFTASVTDLFSWRVAIGAIGVICIGLSFIFARSLPPSVHFRRQTFKVSYLFTSLYRHLRDPGLLCLYGIAFLLTGGFVTMYNYITFRLLGTPYHFSHTTVSWLFLVYLIGSWSSASAGKVSRRLGRDKTLVFAITLMGVGATITLAPEVPAMVCGMAVFTAGFFAAHATASSWVGSRAATAKAQASSLYLCSYYLGSSISGTVGGVFWSTEGWSGVVALICSLVAVGGIVAAVLSRVVAREEAPHGEEPAGLALRSGN
ncbi:MFS transporter [Geomonas sp. RF6]|uniref:MFS transporter n=1 Tax=Geomonas sp. RF6 TaxID=2897342 RepID=UPI001E4CBFFD|nr:MFS transporter [Geomonas sp. RF6]UFS69386.1 MFS transporter [Geomonas sp. RF6]